jgi:hypothetical protein
MLDPESTKIGLESTKIGLWSLIPFGRAVTLTRGKAHSQLVDTKFLSNLARMGFLWLFVHVNFLLEGSNSIKSHLFIKSLKQYFWLILPLLLSEASLQRLKSPPSSIGPCQAAMMEWSSSISPTFLSSYACPYTTINFQLKFWCMSCITQNTEKEWVQKLLVISTSSLVPGSIPPAVQVAGRKFQLKAAGLVRFLRKLGLKVSFLVSPLSDPLYLI